jgi:hypothetical protein
MPEPRLGILLAFMMTPHHPGPASDRCAVGNLCHLRGLFPIFL